MVDGKLAEDILFVGSQVPMSDNQGNRMMGIVKEVGDETVKMDFNHPMAGKTLNFDVEVVSVRDVTPEDCRADVRAASAAVTAAKAAETTTAIAIAISRRRRKRPVFGAAASRNAFGERLRLRANRYHPTKKPGLRVRFFSEFS